MKRFKSKQSLKKEKNIPIQQPNIKIYAKDNVFDNFDITDLIKKDLLIPKTDLQHFIYKKDINNSNISSTSTNDASQLDKDQEEIISEINNNNHFNIEIEKLILIYKNGYEVPFINMYTPIKLIGQGHFGLVLSVVHNETNQKMAVKIIQKKNFSDEYYLTETQLLNKLNHERVIKLYDVVDTEEYLFIFTELCQGGSLKDYIISKYNSNQNYFMKDSECSKIIKNIMQGVEYLTNNGFALAGSDSERLIAGLTSIVNNDDDCKEFIDSIKGVFKLNDVKKYGDYILSQTEVNEDNKIVSIDDVVLPKRAEIIEDEIADKKTKKKGKK